MIDLFDEIQQFAARQVALGFDLDEEIVESANHLAFERSEREDLDPDVRRIVADVSDRHRIEETGWNTPTDCDRIDKAFADLETQGILARQNFTCCNNCGFAEIDEEIEAADSSVEGYTFFHFQSTDRALDCGELLLGYGSVDEGSDALLRIGRTIVEALNLAGLKATWAENDRSPIVVSDLVWKKRRAPAPMRDSGNPSDASPLSGRTVRRGSCS